MDIYNAAESILEQIEGVFAEAGVDLPARKFITLGGQGDVAYDCVQLSVSWDQSYSGTPGDQSQEPSKCDSIHSGAFVVELVRCIPTSKATNTKITPPPVTAINAAASSMMRDANLLFQAGMQACEYTVFGAGLVDVNASAPNGGFQAIIMNVTMSV